MATQRARTGMERKLPPREKSAERRLEDILQMLRSHPTFPAALEVLDEMLEQERDVYENTPASEYTRGRVTQLREIINRFKG